MNTQTEEEDKVKNIETKMEEENVGELKKLLKEAVDLLREIEEELESKNKNGNTKVDLLPLGQNYVWSGF
ncbi:MAG: hypothetical protein ACP5T6_03740 [Candidatus Micrarchaeia archaeon]